jgi:hypothetical protein
VAASSGFMHGVWAFCYSRPSKGVPLSCFLFFPRGMFCCDEKATHWDCV